MLDLIRNINIEVAGYLSVAILLLIIVLHGLVILKIIPYTWINGGRSVSYEEQKKQSILGVIVLLAIIPFLLVASKIIAISVGSIIINSILFIAAVLLMVSAVMQLLGTTFERYVVSVLVFILLICVVRMMI